MEAKIVLDNLDGFAIAGNEEEISPLVITATDEFQEGEEEKNYISFNIEIGARAARFLALKSDVKEFFKALKKEIND